MSKDAVDHALDVWRDAAALARNYKPRNPSISHSLAERAHSKNLQKEALSLVVNLHKRAPRYPELGAAYALAATVLREMGDTAKAAQIEKFIEAFLARREEQSELQIVSGNLSISSAR